MASALTVAMRPLAVIGDPLLLWERCGVSASTALAGAGMSTMSMMGAVRSFLPSPLVIHGLNRIHRRRLSSLALQQQCEARD